MSSDMLHYRVTKGASDHTVILVHPMGADGRFWDEMLAHMDGAADFVICDLRGAGLSPQGANVVSLGQHVSDLEAVRRDLAVDRCVIAGCAIGSQIAAAYAEAYPRHAAGLFLCNPGVRTPAAAREMLENRAERVRTGGMDAIIPDAIDRAFEKQPRDARYDLYTRMFRAHPPQGYAAIALGVIEYDVENALKGLSCPVSIVAGRHDLLLPPAVAEQVRAVRPDARFEMIENGAHFLPFQNAERVAGLLREFLAQGLK
jgi:3-oxoadipate enol-lactonase